MSRLNFTATLLLAGFVLGAPMATAAQNESDNPRARVTTSLGVIEIELYPAKAPATVANFIQYADSQFYNGTIFHRVIDGFMIQGGGFEPGMKLKPNRPPIRNEADNGLKNESGTIAMARTSDPDSASSQFFINSVDNPPLDHTGKNSSRTWGYTVFGRVTKGMDVVRKIEKVATGTEGPFQNVPKTDVLIKKVEILKPKKP